MVKLLFGQIIDMILERSPRSWKRDMADLLWRIYTVTRLWMIGIRLYLTFKIKKHLLLFWLLTQRPEGMALLLPLVILLFIIATITI